MHQHHISKKAFRKPEVLPGGMYSSKVSPARSERHHPTECAHSHDCKLGVRGLGMTCLLYVRTVEDKDFRSSSASSSISSSSSSSSSSSISSSLFLHLFHNLVIGKGQLHRSGARTHHQGLLAASLPNLATANSTEQKEEKAGSKSHQELRGRRDSQEHRSRNTRSIAQKRNDK